MAFFVEKIQGKYGNFHSDNYLIFNNLKTDFRKYSNLIIYIFEILIKSYGKF